MTELSTSTKYWKDKYGAAVSALVAASVAVLALVVALGVLLTQNQPAVVLEKPPVIIKVDNVGCVIAEEPTLTYYVTTDTVRVTIECDSDILFNYLPAVAEEIAL